MCQTLQNATQNTALPNYQLGLLWWAYLLCRRSLKLQTIFRMILPNNTSSFRHQLRRWEGLRPRSHLQPQAPGGHLWRHSLNWKFFAAVMVPWSQRFSNPRPPNIEQRRGEKGKKNTRRRKKGATFSFVAQDKRFCFVSDKSLVAQESAWIYTCFVRLLSEMSVARRRTVSTKMTDFRFWETMWRHTQSREFITQEQKRLECWWTGENRAWNDQWTGRPSSFPGSFPYSTTSWGSDWDPSPAN